MLDYSKMKCYDMRMYLLEWTVLNPKAGSDIKYIFNMSKSQLIKTCSYTEDKLSKEELIELMDNVKNLLKNAKKRLKDKKEQCENESNIFNDNKTFTDSSSIESGNISE
jgi:hypothetical protein